VIGVAAGSTLAFVADEVEEIHEVVVPRTGSQFRSRDAFPALLPGLLAGNTDLLAAPLTRQKLPVVPAHAVAYVDGYGNLETTWQNSLSRPAHGCACASPASRPIIGPARSNGRSLLPLPLVDQYWTSPAMSD
jgi:hypothetical protein